jgi:pilus assembly protein CpaB
LAALSCLLLAGLSALGSRHNATGAVPDKYTDVLVSAHPLAAGATLTDGDIRLARWPTQLRPATSLHLVSDGVGRRITSPVGAGEPITAERLVGSALTAHLPAGLVAAPVTVDSITAAGLVGAGDYVDLFTTPSTTDDTTAVQLLAANALVLAVLPGTETSVITPAQLIVAVDRATALRIAQAGGRPVLATLGNPP